MAANLYFCNMKITQINILSDFAIYKLIFISAIIFFSKPQLSAEIPDSTYRFSAETNISFSTGHHTPFWLANNRFGLSSIEKNNGYVRGAIFKDSELEKKKFTWGAGEIGRAHV